MMMFAILKHVYKLIKCFHLFKNYMQFSFCSPNQRQVFCQFSHSFGLHVNAMLLAFNITSCKSRSGMSSVVHFCDATSISLVHMYVWGRGIQHHSGKSSRKPSYQPGQTCYLQCSTASPLYRGSLLLLCPSKRRASAEKRAFQRRVAYPLTIPLHPHLLHPESEFVKGALHKSQETWKVQCYHTIVPLYLLWTYYIRPF